MEQCADMAIYVHKKRRIYMITFGCVGVICLITSLCTMLALADSLMPNRNIIQNNIMNELGFLIYLPVGICVVCGVSYLVGGFITNYVYGVITNEKKDV